MQPQFWLKVRKDYVMDNFESLINYLRRYKYEKFDANYGNTNGDFNDSLACMEEVADDIFNDIECQPLHESLTLPYDNAKILRLLSAIILASKKKDITNHKAILRIATLIVRKNLYVGAFPDLMRIVTSALRGEKIATLPISWDDISAENTFLLGAFIEKFLKFSFKPLEDGKGVRYVENHGLLMLPPTGVPQLSVLNLYRYEREANKAVNVQLSDPDVLDFMVPRCEYEKPRDFATLLTICNKLLARQASFTPSPTLTLKNYSRYTPMLVRIVEKFGVKLVAETIDPQYQKIKGKVNLMILNEENRPQFYTFQSRINEGDYLTVRLSQESDYAFEIADEFEMFYREYAAEDFDQRAIAIFVAKFPTGDLWLTEAGVYVGVHDSKKEKFDAETRADYQRAIYDHLPIHIKFYDKRPHTDNETFFMYADVGNENGEVLAEESRFSRYIADSKLIDYYLECMAEDATHLLEEAGVGNYEPFEQPSRLYALLALVTRIAETNCHNTMQRLQTLTMAEMLARILDRKHDAQYLRVQKQYLTEIVGFVANRQFETIELPEPLVTDAKCVSEADILKTLRTYRHKENMNVNPLHEMSDSDTLKAVSKLVEASNSLIDIIDITELNNIKQAISRVLGVDDEFESILDNRTFYGMESINLEFKSSVVFPPANRRRYEAYTPEPDIQKWAIIKSVCGFLNSRNGGELLIGVNDAGYAVGLDEDIRALAICKRINHADIDHYRNYVQIMLDQAFGKEPTNDRDKLALTPRLCSGEIRVEAETNAERRTILRVKVSPYPSGIIAIAADDRPASIKEVYVRDSGRTVEMTDTMRATVAKYKGL